MSAVNDCRRILGGKIFSVKKVEQILAGGPPENAERIDKLEARVEKLETKLRAKPKKEPK